MSYLTTKETADRLSWAINSNRRENATKFYEVGLYDSTKYLVKQTRPGLIFDDLINQLNHLGFNLYAISSDDGLLYLIVEDRNLKGVTKQ